MPAMRRSRTSSPKRTTTRSSSTADKKAIETAKLKRLLAAEKRKKALENAKIKRLLAAEKAKKAKKEGRMDTRRNKTKTVSTDPRRTTTRGRRMVDPKPTRRGTRSTSRTAVRGRGTR